MKIITSVTGSELELNVVLTQPGQRCCCCWLGHAFPARPSCSVVPTPVNPPDVTQNLCQITKKLTMSHLFQIRELFALAC